jgi:hypothetical protein
MPIGWLAKNRGKLNFVDTLFLNLVCIELLKILRMFKSTWINLRGVYQNCHRLPKTSTFLLLSIGYRVLLIMLFKLEG